MQASARFMHNMYLDDQSSMLVTTDVLVVFINKFIILSWESNYATMRS
jgi:hypothetical protein